MISIVAICRSLSPVDSGFSGKFSIEKAEHRLGFFPVYSTTKRQQALNIDQLIIKISLLKEYKNKVTWFSPQFNTDCNKSVAYCSRSVGVNHCLSFDYLVIVEKTL